MNSYNLFTDPFKSDAGCLTAAKQQTLSTKQDMQNCRTKIYLSNRHSISSFPFNLFILVLSRFHVSTNSVALFSCTQTVNPQLLYSSIRSYEGLMRNVSFRNSIRWPVDHWVRESVAAPNKNG